MLRMIDLFCTVYECVVCLCLCIVYVELIGRYVYIVCNCCMLSLMVLDL